MIGVEVGIIVTDRNADRHPVTFLIIMHSLFFQLHYLDTTPLIRPAPKRTEKVIGKYDFEGSVSTFLFISSRAAMIRFILVCTIYYKEFTQGS